VGRTIIVGDLHGCADEFCDLLESVAFAQGVDDLVLVGDLVARGPDSRGAIDRARSLGARCVRGNHDEKLLRWWHADRAGGQRKVRLGERHAIAAAQLDDEHFVFLATTPLTLALPSHGARVVHAGVDPSCPIDAQDPALLMNIRSIDADGRATRKLDGTPWARAWEGPEHIVFGHDARRKLQLEPNATGLDTGCCYGRSLTALVLDQDQPIPSARAKRKKLLRSVPARAAWCPMGDGNGEE